MASELEVPLATLIDRNGRSETIQLEEAGPYLDVAFCVPESQRVKAIASPDIPPAEPVVARFVKTRIVASDSSLVYIQRW